MAEQWPLLLLLLSVLATLYLLNSARGALADVRAELAAVRGAAREAREALAAAGGEPATTSPTAGEGSPHRRRPKAAEGRPAGLLPMHVAALVHHTLPHRHFGGKSYGGWTAMTRHLGPEAVVWSIGIGEDISFDLALIAEYQLHVYGFDPTPKAIQYVKAQRPPPQFHFHPYGIGDRDGTTAFYLPKNPKHVSGSVIKGSMTGNQQIDVELRTFASLQKLVGQAGRAVEILKLDIEGMEGRVLADIAASFGGCIPARQVLVEVHSVKAYNDCCRTLQAAGFVMFSGNAEGRVVGTEFSFIQLTRPTCLQNLTSQWH
eukprot:EG_transcript_15260